ncbi:BGTF surface domain-containing protein [Haloarcula salinisoli]|uniref:DUF7827 domain-containing protein n=1 Tax=Haloarcula salinisoli TaxID=2487746 RepID=UPI002E2C8D35|nr:BGTF surface domain-containing protein [Halomicroarcula salinisoli]
MYRVRELNDDDEPGTLRRSVNSEGDGTIEFDLDGQLSEGDFVIVNPSGQPINVGPSGVGTSASLASDGSVNASDQFEVVTMDLSAEFEDSSVGNDGGSTDVEYEVTSDIRADDYSVNISAEGLDTDELGDIFQNANINTTYEDEDTIEVTQSGSGTADGTFDLNFTDIDADTYTFEANVTDADASDTDTIEVTDTGSAEADFGDNVFVEQRGDIANITVEMSNTDEATIQIGQDSNGYAAVAEVTDDDEDGVAYVEFNTFTAGHYDERAEVITGGDEDTDVTVTSSSNLTGNGYYGGDILDATSYDMFVTEGFVSSVDSDNADARATLQLSEASVDSTQIWTAPEDIYDDLADEDAEDIGAYTGTNLTQTDTVAAGDTVVVQVQASGLEGALENRGGILSTDSATDIYGTISEQNENTIPAGLKFESEPIPNVDEPAVNISQLGSNNYSVVYDEANDQHFVVVDSTAMVDAFENTSAYTFDDGDLFTANFTAYENSDLVDDDVSVTGDFNVEDAEAELDTNEDDEIVLQAASGQEVTGETNLAPGTELELELDSDTSGDPFVKRPEAVVQEDGTFTAVADFSENSAGSEFTASIIAVSGDEYDGRLVDGPVDPGTETPGTDTQDTPEPTDTATATDTPEPMTDTATATDTATETADEATETGTSGGSGPGFTAALALIALVAAALLAVRRNN